MDHAYLDTVTLEAPGTHDATVLWMHGLGADGNDFPPIVPELALPNGHGIRFIFPHAPIIPVTLNQGMRMRAWYDIQELDLRREHDMDGLRRSSAQIQALLERERSAGIAADRILLAGFSQGGAVALHLGLRHGEALAGIVALSTYLVDDGSLENERSEANRRIPILQCHGTIDPMVPHERGMAARDRLQELGYSVDWHEYRMMHQVCLEEIEVVGAFIRGRLA